MTIAIVTDSTSDIPPGLREKWHIHQIPAALIINGQTFQDGIDITRNEFYRLLPELKKLPSTASPSTGEFADLYRSLLSQGYSEILSIHLSSTLSSLYDTAHMAAKAFQDRVTAFDSKQVSLGLGFQVLEAAKAAANALPLPRILDRLRHLQDKIYLFAVLDTLDYILKSGRVPWVKARLGKFLDLKPMLQLQDGAVLNAGFSRIRSRAISRLHEKIHSLGPVDSLAVLHSNAEGDGKRFLSRYRDLPPERTFLVNVTTSIGTHVGPNGLGFVAMVK